MKNQIRALENSSKDYTALANLFNSFKDSDSWPDGFGGDLIYTEENVRRQYEAKILENHIIIETADKSEIAGICFICKSWVHHDSWYIELLGVNPKFQGDGYGKALLLYATDLITKRNVQILTLETWGGNLKAMPLYKRQGYKWRPNTRVFMDNYIPQILNFPLFKDFFATYSWYDNFKPNITQTEDDLFDDKMTIYEYYFEANKDNFLKVIIDRSVGKISGFHLKMGSDEIKISAKLPSTTNFIGIDEFQITLETELSLKEADIDIKVSCTEEIEIKGDMNPQINSRELSSNIYTAVIKAGTEELNIKENPEEYSKTEIVFNSKLNGISFSLTVGVIPQHSINVSTTPESFVTQNSKEVDIPIQINNFTGQNKNIAVELYDGELISFNEHSKKLKLSEFDSEIICRANIKETTTKVDHFNIEIKGEDGRSINRKELPILIFDEDKAVSYKFGQKIIVENKSIRMHLFKKSNPGDNCIYIEDKNREIKVEGYPMLLGYPFDEYGSEFYTKDLTHKVTETYKGIEIISEGESSETTGIIIRRKVHIPNSGSTLFISFEVHNNSDSEIDNLGLMLSGEWWGGAIEQTGVVIPFKDGIVKRSVSELVPEWGDDPYSLSEGWKAIEYINGVSGSIINRDEIDKIELNYDSPRIEYKIGKLKAGETYSAINLCHHFCSSWKDVRMKWLALRNPVALNNQELKQPLYKNSEKIGLVSNGKKVSHGLIIPKQQTKLSIVLDSYKKSKLIGNLELDIKSIGLNSGKVDINNIEANRFESKVSIKPESCKRIASGKLTYNTLARIYETPVALSFYNKDESVKITEVNDGGNNYYEADNGFLKFQGSKDFLGTLHHLTTKDDNGSNYLLSYYPEKKPFLWWSRFYGGIGSKILKDGSWEIEDFKDTQFSGFKSKEGIWEGFGFKSEILDFHPSVKGLELTIKYLTLPESPLLLVNVEITNHSGVPRVCDSKVYSSDLTSQTTNDRFYCQDKQSFTTFQARDLDVNTGFDVDRKWIAHHNAGKKYILGQVHTPKTDRDNVNLWQSNFKLIQMSITRHHLVIQPGETNKFNSLFVLAENLDEFEPFANSNLEDLLNI